MRGRRVDGAVLAAVVSSWRPDLPLSGSGGPVCGRAAPGAVTAARWEAGAGAGAGIGRRESVPGAAEHVLFWAGGGHGDVQAPDRGAHPGADLEESSPERLQPGAGEAGAGESRAEPLEEDIGEGREAEPQRVSVEL